MVQRGTARGVRGQRVSLLSDLKPVVKPSRSVSVDNGSVPAFASKPSASPSPSVSSFAGRLPQPLEHVEILAVRVAGHRHGGRTPGGVQGDVPAEPAPASIWSYDPAADLVQRRARGPRRRPPVGRLGSRSAARPPQLGPVVGRSPRANGVGRRPGSVSRPWRLISKAARARSGIVEVTPASGVDPGMEAICQGPTAHSPRSYSYGPTTRLGQGDRGPGDGLVLAEAGGARDIVDLAHRQHGHEDVPLRCHLLVAGRSIL